MPRPHLLSQHRLFFTCQTVEPGNCKTVRPCDRTTPKSPSPVARPSHEIAIPGPLLVKLTVKTSNSPSLSGKTPSFQRPNAKMQSPAHTCSFPSCGISCATATAPTMRCHSPAARKQQATFRRRQTRKLSAGFAFKPLCRTN